MNDVVIAALMIAVPLILMMIYGLYVNRDVDDDTDTAVTGDANTTVTVTDDVNGDTVTFTYTADTVAGNTVAAADGETTAITPAPPSPDSTTPPDPKPA